MEINALSGFEFQNWISRELGIQGGKKGADGGIDGLVYGRPLSVKRFQAGRPQLDQFSGALLRNGSKEAVFVATEFANTFEKEVRRLKVENGVEIFYFTVADIVDKKHESILAKFKYV